jgi:NAD(P) transhydrogenase
MFYMPGTKMLFGDAKDSCDGAPSDLYAGSLTVGLIDTFFYIAIKRGLEARG